VDIVQVGDPVLRRRAQPVPEGLRAGAFVQQLVVTMVQAMRDAPGVGLAAPQVGESLQILVMADDDEERHRQMSPVRRAELGRALLPLQVVVNPVLTPIGSETDELFEGCLSVTGFSALVTRFRRVHLTGVDAGGAPVDVDLEGWPARIAQHECDHLAGTLYIDRMDSRTFTTAANHDRYCKARPAAEVRRLSSPDR